MNPFASSRRPAATGPGESLAFLRGFLRNPAQVGSVIPSSAQLEQRLLRCAQVEQARTVVELGPGTGGTSSALLGAIPTPAVLLGIELDAGFFEGLRRSIRDPRLILEHASAERLGDLLDAHGLGAPDAIVSGIPFSTMPPAVSQRIAACVAGLLRPGGRFVAYQVRAHVADYVSPHLGVPRKQWELLNIPPVRVFTWTKP